jgi:hypothetical protein
LGGGGAPRSGVLAGMLLLVALVLLRGRARR